MVGRRARTRTGDSRFLGCARNDNFWKKLSKKGKGSESQGLNVVYQEVIYIET